MSQVLACQLGDRDPIAVNHVAVDQAHGRAVGQQHICRPFGKPELGHHIGRADRATPVEPGEEIQLVTAVISRSPA